MTHKGELALPKYWKTLWEHELKTRGHPQLPVWAGLQRAHRVPKEGLVMTEFIEVVPAPAVGLGTGGLYAAPLPPSTAGTWLIPVTQWVTPATLWSLHVLQCKKAQPIIWAGTWLSCKNDAFVLAMLEACLIIRRRCWPPLRQKPAVDHQKSLDGLQLSPFSYLKKSMQWGK